RPRRDDDAVRRRPGRTQKLRNIVGTVLAVAIHDDDVVAADVLEDMAKADRKRALVTLIGHEADDADLGNDLSRTFERRRWPIGAVVDHDEGNRTAFITQSRFQFLDEDVQRVPVVVDGGHDRNVRFGHASAKAHDWAKSAARGVNRHDARPWSGRKLSTQG